MEDQREALVRGAEAREEKSKGLIRAVPLTSGDKEMKLLLKLQMTIDEKLQDDLRSHAAGVAFNAARDSSVDKHRRAQVVEALSLSLSLSLSQREPLLLLCRFNPDAQIVLIVAGRESNSVEEAAE